MLITLSRRAVSQSQTSVAPFRNVTYSIYTFEIAVQFHYRILFKLHVVLWDFYGFQICVIVSRQVEAETLF